MDDRQGEAGRAVTLILERREAGMVSKRRGDWEDRASEGSRNGKSLGGVEEG